MEKPNYSKLGKKEFSKQYWRWYRLTYPDIYKQKQREARKKYRDSHKEQCKIRNKISWEKWSTKKGIKEHLQKYRKKYNRRWKLRAIDHYSDGLNVCSCCGESYIEFLTIDHIYGKGRKHREGLTTNYYKTIIQINDKQKYRVLCMNCNTSMGFYGYCPHKKSDIPKGVGSN